MEFLCNHKNSGASTMAFAPSGISARVSGLKTSACVICNTKYHSESDTLNTDMKNLRGVCAAGWGEPCPALPDATAGSTNRGNALGRGESSPQLEMGTAHLLVFEPFPYLELALVALAEIPEADAEGVFL